MNNIIKVGVSWLIALWASNVFIGSLFILYFIYQIWEIVFLNKHFKQDSLPI